jgi:prolyl-tRNA editing enzyme YbaK/EbsC (Cys-tRNA(Pro) deacylase)
MCTQGYLDERPGVNKISRFISATPIRRRIIVEGPEIRLNAADLQTYMQEHGIQGEILRLDVLTPTVVSAAQALRVLPEQIVKSILFLVQGEPVLAVACGTLLVDQRTIAAHYSVGRKKVKLASPEVVLDISGFEVGAMPPFGHRRSLPTLLDPQVLQPNDVFAGGGDNNAMVRLSPQDILKVTHAEVLDLHTPPSKK